MPNPREELEAALNFVITRDSFFNGELGRASDLIEAAARMQLALMPDANGRYKSLTVEKVENVLLSQYDYEVREAMLSVVQPLAIAVLDALNAESE